MLLMLIFVIGFTSFVLFSLHLGLDTIPKFYEKFNVNVGIASILPVILLFFGTMLVFIVGVYHLSALEEQQRQEPVYYINKAFEHKFYKTHSLQDCKTIIIINKSNISKIINLEE